MALISLGLELLNAVISALTQKQNAEKGQGGGAPSAGAAPSKSTAASDPLLEKYERYSQLDAYGDNVHGELDSFSPKKDDKK